MSLSFPSIKVTPNCLAIHPSPQMCSCFSFLLSLLLYLLSSSSLPIHLLPLIHINMMVKEHVHVTTVYLSIRICVGHSVITCNDQIHLVLGFNAKIIVLTYGGMSTFAATEICMTSRALSTPKNTRLF